MDRSTPIYLIKQTYTEDEFGVLQPMNIRRLAYANVASVSASEWFEGGRNGLTPELRATMFAYDYEGEEVAEVGENTYAVYRTYHGKNDLVELYLERRKGRDYESEG